MKKCKLCKRLDDKLLVKGERCATHKCSANKKSFKRKKPLSEYGSQLQEKQKMKILYSLREKQFKNYVAKAVSRKNKDASESLIEFLETRLDSAVYRVGFAVSRDAARQMVGHGHILLNSKKVNIPSYHVKPGDKISIRENSRQKKIFQDLDLSLKKYNPPSWINLDKGKKEGEIVGIPSLNENEFKVNTTAIIEFYSR